MIKRKQKLSTEELLEQALVPEIEWPYEVPENWVWVQLTSVLSRLTDGSHYSPKTLDNGKPYITVRDISNGIIDFENSKFISEEDYIKLCQTGCRPNKGDVLFSKDGTVGKVAYVDFNKEFVVLSSLAIMSPNHQIIKSTYLEKLLNSPQLLSQAIGAKTGTAIRRIVLKDIAKLKIPIPPMAEQQRIVDCIEPLFSKLDAANEIIENVLVSFENRKSAIFYKAFSGELTKNWREEKGLVLSDWKFSHLCETDIDIIDGDRGVNYPKKDEFTPSGYCLFLNAKNVTKNGFVFEKMEFISKERDEILRKGKLKRGDIVLTTRGTIGNIAYYDETVPYNNIRINSGMVIYRGGKDFYKPFLYWLYKSDYILSQIDNLKTGSAQPQLPIKIMKDLVLPIPSILEQIEIVKILESIFEKEQNAKSLIDVLERIDLIKNTVLSQAFRGELGTNNEIEESAIRLLEEIIQSQEAK